MPFCNVSALQKGVDAAAVDNGIKIFYQTYGRGPIKVLMIIGNQWACSPKLLIWIGFSIEFRGPMIVFWIVVQDWLELMIHGNLKSGRLPEPLSPTMSNRRPVIGTLIFWTMRAAVLRFVPSTIVEWVGAPCRPKSQLIRESLVLQFHRQFQSQDFCIWILITELNQTHKLHKLGIMYRN